MKRGGDFQLIPSPENGLSRFPVLRVCRRRQAGNLDDSTGSQRDTTRKQVHSALRMGGGGGGGVQ